MSLKDRILSAEDIPTEIVDVPEWGVKLLIKGMTGGDRSEMLSRAIGDDGGVDLKSIYPDVVVITTHDPETGERIFSADDIPALMAKSGKAIDRVAIVGMRLSGFEEDAVDTAGKGSSKTRRGGSSSR